MSEVTLTAVDPTPDDVQYLEDRIYEFNSSTTGIRFVIALNSTAPSRQSSAFSTAARAAPALHLIPVGDRKSRVRASHRNEYQLPGSSATY